MSQFFLDSIVNCVVSNFWEIQVLCTLGWHLCQSASWGLAPPFEFCIHWWIRWWHLDLSITQKSCLYSFWLLRTYSRFLVVRSEHLLWQLSWLAHLLKEIARLRLFLILSDLWSPCGFDLLILLLTVGYHSSFFAQNLKSYHPMPPRLTDLPNRFYSS